MDAMHAGDSTITGYTNALNNLQNQDTQQRQFIADRQMRAQQDSMADGMVAPSAPGADTSMPAASPVQGTYGATPAPTAPAASTKSGAGTVTAPLSTPGVYANPDLVPNQSAAESARLGRSGIAPPIVPNDGLLDRGVNYLLDKAGMGQNSPTAQAGRTAYLNRLNPPGAGVQNEALLTGRDDAAIAKLKATDANIRGIPATQPDAVTKYDPIIQSAAQSAGIDPTALKRLIESESSFNPTAVSPRGAQYGYGIAQIAASHGLSKQQMEDPSVAIPFAANLLKQYADKNGGDMNAALLQYKGASSAGGIALMQPIVTKILTGIVPGSNAQAATPPAGATVSQAPEQPVSPQGPGQTYAPGQGADYNFDAQATQQQLAQVQQQFALAKFKAQNAATPAERDMALSQMQQMQTTGQQLHQQLFSGAMMQGVRQVEAGNMGALGQMVQAMSQNTGTHWLFTKPEMASTLCSLHRGNQSASRVVLQTWHTSCMARQRRRPELSKLPTRRNSTTRTNLPQVSLLAKLRRRNPLRT
jgi:soluble lytic murein transglycosylase-like protein